VYDNGGKSIDRYTVVYAPYPLPYADGIRPVGTPVFPYVCMSGAPFHPQGVCQHGEGVGRRPTGGWANPDTGHVIAFEELPPDCQEAVHLDLKDEED